jgi:hypothetical protein
MSAQGEAMSAQFPIGPGSIVAGRRRSERKIANSPASELFIQHLANWARAGRCAGQDRIRPKTG